jgi:hypothetical protein
MATTKITTPELFNFSDLNTALQLPSGDNASRPSAPSDGEWRFNTEEKYVEYYDSGTTAWYQIDTEVTCTTNTVDYPTTNTAYYKLDSTALDQTTNNYDGTETNMTYCNGQEYSQGAVFNASNSYITLPVGLGTSGDRTRSFWVKVNNLDVVTTALYIGDLTANAYYETVNIRTTGVVRYQERHDTATNSVTLDSSSTIQTNTWNHIAYVFSGSTRTLYLNGAQVGQTTSSYSTVNNSSYGGYIGAFGGANNPPIGIVNGKMDQFRFFSSELTSAQITELYNEVQCPCTTNTVDNPTTNAVYYKLDGNANDSTSGAKNGTWGGTEAYAYGPYGIAGDFNGTSSLITVASSLPWSSSFSLSMWLRPDSGLSGSGYYLPFFQKDYDSGVGGVGLAFYLNGYVLHPWIGDVGGGSNYYNIFNTGTLTADTWNHVVLTRTYNAQWELFLNGASLGTYTTNGLTQDFSGTEYYFGANGYAIGVGGTPYYYPGEIDQVRIFSSALSASQVTSLYDEVYCNTVSTLNIFNEGTSSCLALYEFEDNANSTDSSTYNGTWSGTEAYGGGQYKKGGIFNGTSSYIDIPSAIYSSISGPFTLSAWIKTTSSGSYKIIIGMGGVNGVASKGLTMWMDSSGLLYASWGNGSTEDYWSVSATTPLNTGDWVHVAITVDGLTNPVVKGYVNGVAEGSGTTGSDSITFDTSLTIGARDMGGTVASYWDGSIDQVRIFNKELTATEVLQVYTE